MTLVGMPYDLKAKCSWDGDLLHIELPETPKAIHVHHPCGNTFFGVPTRVEQELRSENTKLRELVKAMTPFLCCMPFASCNTLAANVRKRMRELGIEVDG